VKLKSQCIQFAGRKLNGGALLFSLVISLLILVLISSIISINYYHSVKYAYNVQLNRLKNNVESATNLALAGPESTEEKENHIDLFGSGKDSVKIRQWNFGLFDGFEVEGHYKSVLINKKALAGIESGNSSVFYLCDHGKAISMSGKTELYGNIYFPKSGYQSGYISGNSLQGEPMKGIKYISKEFPQADKTLEEKIASILKGETNSDSIANNGSLSENDSIINSFSNPTLNILVSGDITLGNKFIDGNVLIRCSGKIKVKKTAQLNNVILVGRCVEFEKETQATIQVFATDTIFTEEKCRFGYPSVFVVAQEKNRPAALIMGKENEFTGTVVGLRDKYNVNQPFSFKMGDASIINGQIYFAGPACLNGEINGEVYIEKTFVSTSSSVNDNYMYNVVINKKPLNKRFCFIKLLQQDVLARKQKRSILKWTS
jgi:hypothetical protein